MDIQATKLELVKLIVNLESQEMVEKIFNLVVSEQSKDDFWLETNELEKMEIKKGIEQLDNGEGIYLEDFLKKVAK